MTKKIRFYAITLLAVIIVSAGYSLAQNPTATTSRQQAAAAAPPVTGSGTTGRLTKWAGVDGQNTFVIGNSVISEDKFGKIGIGTTLPTSKLTVQGIIESLSGGFKFPDGSVQTTAGVAPNQVVKSLNGLKGDVSLTPGQNITITPAGNTLTIAATGDGGLTSVAHDATLTGDGSSGSPLKIAVPLTLEGPSPGFISSPVLTVSGGNNSGINGGTGIRVSGGESLDAFGGRGVIAFGGDSANGPVGGDAIFAVGGFAHGVGNRSGAGIVAIGAEGGDGAADGLAGDFERNVEIKGNLDVTGTKNFKIDHPLDPANKYLVHAAIESSEVLNVYSGNASTDANGEAVVTLPDWFEAINHDLRYQLTVVGAFAQAIVAEEVKNNRFTIRTSAPNVKVSWQVTGVRSDAAMKTRPFRAVEDKPESERGYYLTPEGFNQPEEKSVKWARHPALMKQMKERREQLWLKQQSQGR